MKLGFDRLHFHIKRVAGNHRYTGLSRGDITVKGITFSGTVVMMRIKAHCGVCVCVCLTVLRTDTDKERKKGSHTRDT